MRMLILALVAIGCEAVPDQEQDEWYGLPSDDDDCPSVVATEPENGDSGFFLSVRFTLSEADRHATIEVTNAFGKMSGSTTTDGPDVYFSLEQDWATGPHTASVIYCDDDEIDTIHFSIE